MITEFLNNLFKPHITIDTFIMGVFSLFVLALNIPLGIICIIISIGQYFAHSTIIERASLPELESYQDRILKESDEIMMGFQVSDALPMCVADKKGKVFWKNEEFQTVFPETDILTSVLSDKDLADLFEEDFAGIRVKSGEDSWMLNSSPMEKEEENPKKVLFWRNITGLVNLKNAYDESRPCVAYVTIDNYDEIISATAVEDQSLVIAEMDRHIRSWASDMGGGSIRYKSSGYMVAFEQKHLETLRENKFEFLNEMHQIETGADFPTSVSIGIAYNGETYESLLETAAEALELAFGRGGDQAVIKNGHGEIEYFGGALPTVEKRNKGRSRVVAHALQQQITSADSVFVMGHSRADLDSIGACMGIYSIVKSFDVEASIVMNNPGEAIEQLYNASLETNYFEYTTGEEAVKSITDDSLLIIVDCHTAYMTEHPQLVEKAKKIIIIDHHRRSKDAIEDPVLTYMESYASSASELVTEIIQYAGDKVSINKFTAEALLSGITLDTKNFSINCGVRTFEAASWLKRMGADNAVIKSYFKLRLDFVQKKYNIIASAQIMGNGIAVAYTKETDPAMQILVAQAGDELLEMKGIEAAFTAGAGPNKTMVSARSSGKFNVQTIMEKMGGGGHINVAAAQVEESPEEAIQKLVELLREEDLL